VPREPIAKGAAERLLPRFRVGLKDVAYWVAAAAILMGLTRRAWSGHVFRFASPAEAYTIRCFLSATFLLAGIVGLRLGAQVVRLVLGMLTLDLGETPGRRTTVVPAVLWRLLALVVLVGYVDEVTSDLTAHEEFYAAQTLNITLANGPGLRDDLRGQLVPACGLMMMLGLLVGMRPSSARSTGRPGKAWFIVPLAGAVGVGLASGFMMIPYLVLLALEAVSNASDRVFTARTGVAERIDLAAIDGSLALLPLLATAGWVAFDLRRAAREGTPRVSLCRLGIAFRLATFSAMVAMAGRLVVGTIPWLHENLFRGLEGVLSSREVLAIGLGFSGLSAGIAARSMGRTATTAASPSGSRLLEVVSRSVWCLSLLAIIFVATAQWLVSAKSLTDRLPASWVGWMDAASTLWSWVHHLSDPFAPNSHLFLAPAIVWALAVSLRVCGPQAPDRASAFDKVASSPGTLGRFLASSAVLTTLCLCALPTLFVMGLVLYHRRLNPLAGP
jgi:hypothetical protein